MPTDIRESPIRWTPCATRAYERFGQVDFLINNAGGQFPALPSQISDNGWRAVVDLNLNGTWNMVSRFMGPMVAAGRGSIVNVVHIFSFDRGAPWFGLECRVRGAVAVFAQQRVVFVEIELCVPCGGGAPVPEGTNRDRRRRT